MASENDQDRVWKLIEDIGFCMLSTRDGENIRSRPMSAYADRDAHAIYFLTDAASHKDAEVAESANVGLAFADSKGQKYVSVTGSARVSDDRALIRRLWSTPAKAWWDSPDDPSIRGLEVEPRDAQYWDSPGTVASYVKMMAAAVSGTRPAVGDSAKTRL